MAARMAIWTICAMVASLALMASRPAFSLDADRTISQFQHQSWSPTDSTPSDISCLSQTTDGYVWIGTHSGLYRFDGIAFESYEPRDGKLLSREVRALLSTPEGGLWVGYATGSVSYLIKGKITNYAEAEGFPSSSVHELRLAADHHTVWASTGRGLFRFSGPRWEQTGESWGLPSTSFWALFLDNQGDLWTSTIDTLYRLRAGSTAFEAVYHGSGIASGISLHAGAASPDGKIWVTDFDNNALISIGDNVKARDSDPEAPRFAKVAVQHPYAIMTDRDGTLWVSTEEGITRFGERRGDVDLPPDVFTVEHDVASSFLEDREGNVWVGSRESLERFSRRKVVPFPLPRTTSSVALAADHDRFLWIAYDGAVFHIQGSERVEMPFSFPGRISSLYEAPDGTLWVGGQDTLARIVSGRLEQVTPATGPPNPAILSQVQTMTADDKGRLWVSIVRHGLYRLDAGQWHPYGDLDALPKEPAMSAATDSKGRVWFGFPRNRVARIDGDRVTLYSAEAGLAIGDVTALSRLGSRVWVGGEGGLGLFEGERFRMMATWDTDRIGGIKGIVETPQGDLWLSQGTGVVHVENAAIAAKLASPEGSLRHDLLSSRDGMVGQPQFRPAPTVAMTKEGRIWAVSNWGLFWIDPEYRFKNLLPPPVLIRSLIADKSAYFSDAPVVLPVLPSNIEIDYTALSLTQPERVQFRYRLEGLEKDWQDVGARRSAFYNRLAPGRYTFHVIASNNDGVWNTTGASLKFEVPPAFYQTTAFRVVCCLLAATGLWLLYSARLRQVTRQFGLRLDERVNERTRIARELHDTLLQSFQGLILRFQAAKNLLPGQPVEADRVLVSAIERAALALTEGRDAVQALRSPSQHGIDLVRMITQIGEELSNQYKLKSPDETPEFSVTVEGVHRDLRSTIWDDIRRIVSEALTNAFRHAHAQHVEVDIRYELRGLRVRVRDDGMGLEPELASEGGRAGHWGLLGMRERAKSIGGRVEFWSERGAGTEIGLVIPAAIAYAEFTEADSQSTTGIGS
jgi:signal transduction histidine kinase/ligand-binding sensor domain-containing protein